MVIQVAVVASAMRRQLDPNQESLVRQLLVVQAQHTQVARQRQPLEQRMSEEPVLAQENLAVVAVVATLAVEVAPVRPPAFKTVAVVEARVST
jgi:hypothetical protein